jgi:hypothetical protein
LGPGSFGGFTKAALLLLRILRPGSRGGFADLLLEMLFRGFFENKDPLERGLLFREKDFPEKKLPLELV